MGLALMEAAASARIRLTLLDTCYLEGGFDAPLEGPQLRFGDGSAEGWIERVQQLRPQGQARLGAAIHSVRAVPPLAMAEAAEWSRRHDWPLHAHVSEQRREQNDCKHYRGTTPFGVLAAAGAVGPGFTAIHGTHMSKKDIVGLAAEGGACCLCPTTERDLGRRDRPGPGAAARRSTAVDRHRLPRRHRRLRGGSSRRTRQPVGLGGTGPARRRPAPGGRHRQRHGRLGLGRGRAGTRQTGGLRNRPPGHTRTAGADPSLASTAVFAATAADVDQVVVGGQAVVSGGTHVGVPDTAGALAAAITGALPVTSLALTGIGLLVTCDPDHGRGPLGVVENAAVVIEDARVVYAGPAPSAPLNVDVRADLDGRCVMPGFVDCHTHLIFAGDRAEEFTLRMAGRPYQPGGILDTVAATRAASRSDLEARARRLIGQALASGTTTLEIKTGYGLTPEHEAIHLDVARSLTPETTFLGAHLVPPEYRHDRDGYLRLLTETMIPAAAATARWCDVFCESGAFDVGRVPGRAGRGPGPRYGPAGARQPVGTQRRGGAGLRARGRLRRPLHPPDPRRHRPLGRFRDGRHLAAHQRLLHPAALPRRPGPPRRRRHRGGGEQLQSGFELLHLDPAGAGPGGPRVRAHRRRGPAGRHPGRRPGPSGVPMSGASSPALGPTPWSSMRPHPSHLVYRVGAPIVSAVLKDGAWAVGGRG